MHAGCLICCLLLVVLCLGCGVPGRQPSQLPNGCKLLISRVPIPPWWTSREDRIRAALKREVKRGELRTLSRSPGRRPVYVVAYGRPEPRLRGTANYNSAVAAGEPDAYFRRGERKRPVLVILAGVHGQEVEGMVAALSAIRVMETGRDVSGTVQPALRRKLARLRLIVIPVANPDGRARCPYDGWVGLPTREMTRWGQGTRADGTLYGWPGCKAVHPMRKGAGIFGAYFDDNGVNLMHDEWHAPMSRTTAALLKLVSEEGPDMLLNLHTHGSPPCILQPAYVPMTAKQEVLAFARSCYARMDAEKIPHGRTPPARPDGPTGTAPPSLNLTSMSHHAGAALAVTFEGSHGFKDARVRYDYPTILKLHHVLFEAAADWLCREKEK